MIKDDFDVAISWAVTMHIVKSNDHQSMVPNVKGYVILEAKSIEQWKSNRTSSIRARVEIRDSPGAFVAGNIGGSVGTSTASGTQSRSATELPIDANAKTTKTHWLQFVAWAAAAVVAIIGLYKLFYGEGNSN